MVKIVRKGLSKKVVTGIFNVSRGTVWKWCKRAKHRGRESFRDRPRRPKRSKITKKVVLSIVGLRLRFGWGTARIQQALFNLPGFMRKKLNACVQGIQLSRTSVNEVLKECKLNGYGRESKAWKFFRAKKVDELWQLDIKGPFRVRGQKYWFLVCVDDYSRYVLLCKQFNHEPTTKEITRLLGGLRRSPEKILTDNGSQFKLEWERWCRDNGIEPLFAHPYHPQDQGKVERTIRNVAEEFVNLLKKFPEWLRNIQRYRRWYNEHRFHRGINTQPANLYPASI